MSKKITTPIVNLSLKGMSVLSRFFLILYISKYFSIDEVGEYGLFNTSIMFLLLIVGLDFYQFSNREIVAVGKVKRSFVVTQQIILHIISYALFLPLILLIFFAGIIPFKYLIVFYAILILEHINQEIYRTFIALSKSMTSSFLIFLKNGFWALVLLLIWIFSENQVYFNLKYLYVFWLSGNVLALVIGTYKFKQYFDFISFSKVDFNWIKKGLKISIFFLVSTIAFKIIEFSDRYMIDFFLTKTEVGIYTFFFQLSNIVNVVVFNSILIIFYPKILKSISNKDGFVQTKKSMSRQVYTVSFVVAIAIYFGTPFLLDIVDKPEFIENQSILILLLVGNLMLNFSFIYHYILLGLKRDRLLMNVTLVGAVVNVLLNIIFIPKYGILGAAYSSIIGFGIIFLLKFLSSKKSIKLIDA